MKLRGGMLYNVFLMLVCNITDANLILSCRDSALFTHIFIRLWAHKMLVELSLGGITNINVRLNRTVTFNKAPGIGAYKKYLYGKFRIFHSFSNRGPEPCIFLSPILLSRFYFPHALHLISLRNTCTLPSSNVSVMTLLCSTLGCRIMSGEICIFIINITIHITQIISIIVIFIILILTFLLPSLQR